MESRVWMLIAGGLFVSLGFIVRDTRPALGVAAMVFGAAVLMVWLMRGRRPPSP